MPLGRSPLRSKVMPIFILNSRDVRSIGDAWVMRRQSLRRIGQDPHPLASTFNGRIDLSCPLPVWPLVACPLSPHPPPQPSSASSATLWLVITFNSRRRAIRSLFSGINALLLPCSRALTPRVGVGLAVFGLSS